VIGTAALALLAAAGPAHSQEPRRGLEISGYGGVLAFEQDLLVADGDEFRGLKDSPLFGGRIGYTISTRFGIEGSLAFSSHSVDPAAGSTSPGPDVRYVTYLGEGLVYLTSGNVLPFLAAGLGGLSFDVDPASGIDESGSGLMASIGGGLKIPLTPDILIRADVRDYLSRHTDRGQLVDLFGGEGTVRNNIAVTAGVSFRVGGPGDLDRDGIYDDRDECGNTVIGAPVDDRGCVLSVPEGEPPIKTDSDGDGVSDGLDHCPNTPAGAVVDLDGCPIEEGDGETSAIEDGDGGTSAPS
jgi:OOP family OmpA-OmpF porin